MSSVIKQQKVVASKDIGNGVTLGVLEDGTAFANARGVAVLCGIAASTMISWAQGWREGRRDTELARFLVARGVVAGQLHIPTHDGQHAYPDWVVLLILEHYSKENQTARVNLSRLAGHALRDFIYRETNYAAPMPAPVRPVDSGDEWRHFHDRLRLVSVPAKHFCVFKEMSGVVVMSIDAGLRVDEHTVPDQSVGHAWSLYWDANGLEGVYGPRIKFPHNFPAYYPQAASNPQPAWAYPLGALGVFRQWLEDDYLPTKFPQYLGRKVKQGVLAEGTARTVLKALNQSPDALVLPQGKQKLLTPSKPKPKALPAPKKGARPR